jgi:hypothetical protein
MYELKDTQKIGIKVMYDLKHPFEQKIAVLQFFIPIRDINSGFG